ncbi:MAG: hypothetical protein RJQ01_12560 [Microcella sp.]|uniref:hypothetical protein n=1 Tax=Microcella sp. TaxID=1913979 RepID=UPI0033160F7A
MTIELHIAITAREGMQERIEPWFDEVFAPALRRQAGFQSAALMAAYSDAVQEAIGASPAETPTLVVIRFDTEQQRAAWVESDDHTHAWGAVEEIAHHRAHYGWTVLSASESASD